MKLLPKVETYCIIDRKLNLTQRLVKFVIQMEIVIYIILLLCKLFPALDGSNFTNRENKERKTIAIFADSEYEEINAKRKKNCTINLLYFERFLYHRWPKEYN